MFKYLSQIFSIMILIFGNYSSSQASLIPSVLEKQAAVILPQAQSLRYKLNDINPGAVQIDLGKHLRSGQYVSITLQGVDKTGQRIGHKSPRMYLRISIPPLPRQETMGIMEFESKSQRRDKMFEDMEIEFSSALKVLFKKQGLNPNVVTYMQYTGWYQKFIEINLSKIEVSNIQIIMPTIERIINTMNQHGRDGLIFLGQQ